MSTKRATLLGATGMIGSYLLPKLLADSSIETVRVIVRRPFTMVHPKLEVRLVDFNDYESLKLAIDGSDILFCAIGTTQKNVKGDNALYRKIDFDIPVKAARICKETGCTKYVIVSAVGANRASRSFYLKLKGEVEDALEKWNPGAVHIMQPSMLLGDRKEKRIIETLLQGPATLLTSMFAGSWKKYRSIHGDDVATAMINAGKINKQGIFRYTYPEMMALVK